MSNPNNQFTTARLKSETKRRAERAKLTFRFRSFEAALDTFILLGIRAYRESLKQIDAVQEQKVS